MSKYKVLQLSATKHRTHGLINHTIIVNLYHKASYFIVGLIRSLREIILHGHVSLANKYSYA